MGRRGGEIKHQKKVSHKHQKMTQYYYDRLRKSKYVNLTWGLLTVGSVEEEVRCQSNVIFNARGPER